MTFLLDLLAVTAAAAGLLWGCGIPLAHLLLPRRLRPLLPLFAPFLGFALVSALGHWAGALGGSLRDVRWPAAAVAVAGWVLVLLDPRLRRLSRSSLPALAVCALAFLLAAVPLFALGYLTTVGGTVDGLSYATRSEYLQDAPPVHPRIEPGRPWLGWVHSQIRLIRIGDVHFVGLLGLLTGRRSYELLTVVPALFFALTAGSLFALARSGLRLSRRGALLAALLAAINNLLLWPVYDNFLSQTVAIGFLPAVLAAGVEGQRRPGWRAAALFGVLLSALVSVYPVYALSALAGVLAVWGVAWLLLPGGPRGRVLSRAALWWLGAAACAAAWNGMAFARAVPELGFVANLLAPGGARAVGAGNIRVFPPVIEVLGLIPHAAAAHGLSLGRAPLVLLGAFGAGLAALALFGWWRLAPRPRLIAAALLLTGVAFAAQQRWGVNAPHGYPYGWFKMVSALAPLALALLAAGLAALWRLRSKRWLAAAACLLLAGINLRHTLWTQAYVLDTQVVLDRELIEAARAAARVDAGDWLLLDLSRGLHQHWLGYLLRGQRIRYREPLWIVHIETPGEEGAFHRYALVERDIDPRRRRSLDEPWHVPGAYSRLWGNGRYELRERRDTAMAGVSWSRPWPAGDAVALRLGRPAPAGGTAAASLGGETLDIAVEPGIPRTVQVRLFSVGTGTRLAVAGLGEPLELPPGGWLLDLDLGCIPAKQVEVDLAAGDALLADVRVLGAATGEAGACVETAPLRAGAVYLEQRVLGAEVTFDAVLVRPEGAGERIYRVGFHVIDPAQQKLFGVWSLDFPPGERARRGSLRLDLGDRSAGGELDGQPARLETGSFDVDSGSFKGDLVLWQLNPIDQLLVEPVLWFRRPAAGPPEVTRSVPAIPVRILAAP